MSEPERPVVAMLDQVDMTLHRPATGEGKHLRTACGLPLAETTVGPFVALMPHAARLCPECYAV